MAGEKGEHSSKNWWFLYFRFWGQAHVSSRIAIGFARSGRLPGISESTCIIRNIDVT